DIDSVVTRSTDSEKVERQGGSLGWLTLTVLGLLGFRRKFK
ncbi:GlyGly-CTERM sorting domain-containing protein, partial [Vibrio sp. 10N.222.52.C3]